MHPSGRRLWKKWLTCGASALLFAVVAVFFYFYRQLIYLGGNIEISVVFSQLFWKAFLVGLIGFFCFFAILFFGYRLLQPFGNFLYRWRYMVAATVLFACVLLNLNGSSIGCWNGILADGQDDGLLFGVNRAVRSDEWAVNTPMAFAQYYDPQGAYPYFGQVMRGAITDSFIVYGQPVWDIAVLFRPFHWGYLLLGAERGLSFFWCARLIALFMVTFELSMLLTNRKRVLSLASALLVAFSSQVQWWFAVNSLVEMLVFGQLAVLIVHYFMVTKKIWARTLLMIGMAFCGGAYILTFYPSWQVPLGYAFLALIVGVIIVDRKECIFVWKRDFAFLLLFIVLLAGGMAYVLSKSLDTVKIVLNTAYPGARIATGGGFFDRLFNYPATLLFPISQTNLPGNSCEQAVFYDFFPMGIFLSLWILLKEKNRDPFLICLLAAQVVLLAYCTFQFPEALSKILLLSYSQAARAFLAVGFINILLLIRSMTLLQARISPWIAAAIAVLLGILVGIACMRNFPEYLSIVKTVGAALVIAAGFYVILRRHEKLFLCGSLLIVLVSGVLVNPIRQGAAFLQQDSLIKEIRTIEQEEPGIWIVENAGYPLINIPVLAGAPTINSTNVYPNLERWSQLDPEGSNEEIYNRYAHILITLTDEEATEFELRQADVFHLTLNIEDLPKLGGSYILTTRNLDELANSKIQLQLVSQIKSYFIYKVEGALL